MTKELTIAIPAYKNLVFLKRAINSIINQTDGLEKIEIYISIDYSANTDKIIEWIKKYPFIRYDINNPKLGMAENWNNCIRRSHTKYVALLHDDDYLNENYVNLASQVIEKCKDFDAVCFGHEFSKDDQMICQKTDENKLKKISIRRLRSLEYWLGGYNYKTVPTCGIIFNRRSFIAEGGGIEPKMVILVMKRL